MELEAGVVASMALRLLAEGGGLNIIIEQEEMLRMVLRKLKSKSMPKFKEIECGDAGWKVEIELELCFGAIEKCVVLTAGPFQSPKVAKKETICLAFRHLYEECGVKVVDYSSKVAHRLSELNIDDYLSEAVDLVKLMIRNLRSEMGKILELGKRLKEEMQHEQIEDRHDNAKIVGRLCVFLGGLLKRFSPKIIEAKNRLSNLDLQQKNYENQKKEKAAAEATKVISELVVIPSKTFLNYVLSVFGSSKAKYVNGPVEDGLVEGTAKFKIPYISRLKHCGNLRIKATGGNSIESEENAAFASLLLIETDWDVQVVGLNHSARVAAEKDQVSLTALLGEVISVGDTVKEVWAEMVQELEKQSSKMYSELNSLPNTSAQDRVLIFRFCSDELTKLEKETANIGYNIFLEVFDKLEMIAHELLHIK